MLDESQEKLEKELIKIVNSAVDYRRSARDNEYITNNK